MRRLPGRTQKNDKFMTGPGSRCFGRGAALLSKSRFRRRITVQETFEYRPFRMGKVMLLFLEACKILVFLLVGTNLHMQNVGFKIAVCIGLSVLSLFLEWPLYSLGNTAFIFGPNELCVVGDGRRCNQSLPADRFSYACLARNLRNRKYYILSPKELDHREIKRQIYSLNLSLVQKESVLLIPLDMNQDTQRVEQWMEEHIPHVETCAWRGW